MNAQKTMSEKRGADQSSQWVAMRVVSARWRATPFRGP